MSSGDEIVVVEEEKVTVEELNLSDEDKAEGKGKEEESSNKGKQKIILSANKIHPGLPTAAETAANPNRGYSDHLAVIGEAPLYGGKTVKFLSLNTLGLNLSSGIHGDLHFGESEDEIKARYTRIANFLKLSIDKNGLDCILLQETELRTMSPILNAVLGDDWQMVLSDNDAEKSSGLITCYNTAKLTACADLSFDSYKRVLSQSFKHENGILDLHNSWGNFSQNPRIREKEYRDLLTAHAGEENRTSVVAGDSNGRSAPLHDNRQYIATTSIPPKILIDYDPGYPQAERPHVSDYPDCAFYIDGKGQIWQVKTRGCNFDTGEPFLDEELAISAKELKNPSYRAAEYRLLLCLDHSYITTKEVVTGKTLLEYQTELQQRVQDPNIQVSMAANSRNEKALAIWCLGSSPFIQSLKALPGVQGAFLDDNKPVNIAFIPAKQIPAVIAAMDAGLPQLEISSDPIKLTNEQITQLRARSIVNFFVPSDFKIDFLNDLKIKIREALFQNPEANLSAIVDEWSQTEVQLVNPRTEVLETKTNSKWLEIHRSPFSSQEKQTSTSQFLTELKKSLDPNAEAEQSSASSSRAGSSNT